MRTETEEYTIKQVKIPGVPWFWMLTIVSSGEEIPCDSMYDVCDKLKERYEANLP